MTAPTISFGLPLSENQWLSRAIGDEACEVDRRLSEARASDPSIAIAGRQWDLEAACAEASLPNWDGYGAPAVLWPTYLIARSFLEALPLTTPRPDISIDPDGDVMIRWYRDDHAVFVVSASATGALNYAAILGDEQEHGTKQFSGAIPEEFAAILAQLFA